MLATVAARTVRKRLWKVLPLARLIALHFMARTSRYHIQATDFVPLCSSNRLKSSDKLLIWAEWLDLYGTNDAAACVQCRRIALQYRDRSRMIRAIDRSNSGFWSRAE